VQQFTTCSSGGRIEIWYQSRSQMKPKFFNLLYNLVKHISTKFCGIWICILGYIHFSLKCAESVRKVTIIELIWSHFDWKVLKLETCLQVYLSLVLDWSRSMTSKEYKTIWLWSTGVYLAHIWYSNWRSRPSSRWRWGLSSSDHWRLFSRKKMT
jgi:hypothetical protein